MFARFTGTVNTQSRCTAVERHAAGVTVHCENQPPLSADIAVIATHADQALALLSTPTEAELQLLGAWRYSKNTVTLHTDPCVMPPNRKAWSSWLVQQPPRAADPLTMTYYMNRLQNIKSDTSYFVSLNSSAQIDPAKVLK